MTLILLSSFMGAIIEGYKVTSLKDTHHISAPREGKGVYVMKGDFFKSL